MLSAKNSHGQLTTYAPTADDVLWLKRAVAAEGKPLDLVAATLVNGFMWARSEGHWGKTLAEWVRAYAQPVNPRWFESGDLFQARLAKAKNAAEETQLRKLALQRKTVHSVRAKFGPAVLDAVNASLSVAPALGGAVDYARWDITKNAPWVAQSASVPGTNRFWTRPEARGWAGYWADGAKAAAHVGGALVAVVVVLLLVGCAS